MISDRKIAPGGACTIRGFFLIEDKRKVKDGKEEG